MRALLPGQPSIQTALTYGGSVALGRVEDDTHDKDIDLFLLQTFVDSGKGKFPGISL